MNLLLIHNDHQFYRSIADTFLDDKLDQIDGLDEEGLLRLKKNPPKADIVMVDESAIQAIGMDAILGLKQTEACKKLIFVILSNQNDNAESAFDLGATDFISRDFQPSALRKKIHALCEATKKMSNQEQLMFGSISLNVKMKTVKIKNDDIKVTSTEFNILKILLQRPSELIERSTILGEAMNNINITPRTIDVHICSLRKKLARHNIRIETIRGLGYRLNGQNKHLN